VEVGVEYEKVQQGEGMRKVTERGRNEGEDRPEVEEERRRWNELNN
jgi:hypothetical protein